MRRLSTLTTKPRGPLVVGVGYAMLGSVLLAAQAGTAVERPQARWGTITAYADAVAIDSPFRVARARFWDGKSGEPQLSDDSKPEAFPYSATHKHATALEELRGSSVVVVGAVARARSYLSHDGTTIYSEMAVTVSQVLRNKSGVGIAAGSQIAVERAGGVVRQPSGKLLMRGCRDESMPHRSGRYLLVLDYSGALSSMFPIRGAYLLAGDDVYMLDSVEPTQMPGRGGDSSLHMAYFLTRYGLPTADFVEVVQKTLERSDE